MSSHQFLYLSSDDSMDYFPDNSPINFRVKMPNPRLFQCMWLCGVISFQYYDLFSIDTMSSNSPLNFYICSDLCQQSYVNDSTEPVLSRCFIKPINDGLLHEVQISNPIYVPIVQYFKDYIHIYIKGDKGAHISLDKGPSKVTLHLKRI